MVDHETMTWINAGGIAAGVAVGTIALPYLVAYLRRIATTVALLHERYVDKETLEHVRVSLDNRITDLLTTDHVHRHEFTEAKETIDRNSNRITALEVYVELLRNHKERFHGNEGR